VENLAVSREFWRGKRVFVTGHTGFKGGWLSLWLQSLGAEVHGYALEPGTAPDFFSVARVAKNMRSTIADIRAAETLTAAMHAAQPDIVFHLAAQSLVRYSYARPAETYAVNVMGTVNLLEAVRATPGVRAVVVVTTDKCYENREQQSGYRESEPLGGRDPYSSSKACAELVTAAYRLSFLAQAGVALASARAGNVIGGGDWATDRLIPDFLRAMDAGTAMHVRSPNAVRPWQHVLEPLSGYLLLAERLCDDARAFSEAWNFGSADEDARPVSWVVDRLIAAVPGTTYKRDTASQPHEANTLKLDSSKAQTRLGWESRWSLATALDKTLEWHAAWRKGDDMRAATLGQIADYSRQLVER
jgi:CDP-glucose 4,6-dehydratase